MIHSFSLNKTWVYRLVWSVQLASFDVQFSVVLAKSSLQVVAEASFIQTHCCDQASLRCIVRKDIYCVAETWQASFEASCCI